MQLTLPFCSVESEGGRVGGRFAPSLSSFGATTAYFSKFSYSSLSPADTELPRLSERCSGDEQLESPPPFADIAFRNFKIRGSVRCTHAQKRRGGADAGCALITNSTMEREKRPISRRTSLALSSNTCFEGLVEYLRKVFSCKIYIHFTPSLFYNVLQQQ